MAKISRKELKEDEVHDLSVQLMFWLSKNQTVIYIVAGIVLIALLGRSFITSQQTAARLALNERYGENYRIYRRAAVESDAVKRRSGLESALQGFTEFSKNNPGKPAALQAEFICGNILFELERYDEAQAQFEKLSGTAETKADQAQALLASGNCLENKAFRAKAIDEKKQLIEQALNKYDQAIAAVPGSYLSYYALANKARVLGRDPQTREQAIALYDKIVAERPAEQASVLNPLQAKDVAQGNFEEREQMQDMLKSVSFAKLAEYQAEQLRNLSQ